MNIRAAELTITEMVVPASVDAPDAGEFHVMVDLNNALCLQETGIPDLSRTPEDMLPAWLDQTDRTYLTFVARRGTKIVGMVMFICANDEDAQSAELDLMVPSEHWGDGVEDALLARVEEEAQRRNRTSLQIWTLHRAQQTERMLVPPTGWGSVPASALSDFLTSSGFVLEQVERNSALALNGPLPLVEEMLAASLAHAGSEYRVVEWTLPTPEHLRSGYADVIARMATDVPSGDLEIDEETWDEDRIARRDQRFADGGQTVSVAAVEHVPTGRLVAYNELVIGADLTGVTHQFGTLVVKEHRGRRLGTVVKCANLLRWRTIAPLSPKVSTFNAEENRPMLDINEAIGFVPVSYGAAWQKRL
ncbi:N-acetyltransferase family protein [Microbacterium sp. NPDC055903]